MKVRWTLFAIFEAAALICYINNYIVAAIVCCILGFICIGADILGAIFD